MSSQVCSYWVPGLLGSEGGPPSSSSHLIFSLVDAQEKEKLWEEEGDRDVTVDAPSVGLETFQAYQEGEGQQQAHEGEGYQRIGHNGQGLQVALQLLQGETKTEMNQGESTESASTSLFLQHNTEMEKQQRFSLVFTFILLGIAQMIT